MPIWQVTGSLSIAVKAATFKLAHYGKAAVLAASF